MEILSIWVSPAFLGVCHCAQKKFVRNGTLLCAMTVPPNLLAFTSTVMTFWKTVWYCTFYICPPAGTILKLQFFYFLDFISPKSYRSWNKQFRTSMAVLDPEQYFFFNLRMFYFNFSHLGDCSTSRDRFSLEFPC